jgi:hypothetical protein
LGYKLTLHPEEKTLSNSKAIETWIKDMMGKRAQAIDAINRTV